MAKTKPQPNRAFKLDFYPLRVARTASHLTVETLAHSAGVSRWTIYRTERNESVPSLELIIALARALGRPMYELFSVEDGSS